MAEPLDQALPATPSENQTLESAKPGSIKSLISNGAILGHSPCGDIFVHDGFFSVLRHETWRVANIMGLVPQGTFSKKDILSLAYQFPPGPAEITARLANEILSELREGNLTRNTLGIEQEGDLYAEDGATGTLLPKYDNVNFTPDNDEHPEMTASKIETATRHMSNTLFPASSIEVAHALARSILEAYSIARARKGFYVQASVTEGGHLAEVVMTNHPYIKMVYPIRAKSYKKHEAMIPQETRAIWEAVGVDFATVDYGKNPLQGSINAVHYHTSIPRSLGDALFDARIAYVYGIMRLTQISKVMNFALYNTSHLLSTAINGVSDVRAYLRRTLDSTHDSTIPSSASEYFLKAMFAVADGEIHSFSRYPLRGQHERLRLKEIGTCESIDGASNPDLRIVLGIAYFNQLLNALALKALIATEGNETLVPAWLLENYGPLFHSISALKGKDSSFQQDKEFNKKGFAGTVKGMSFAEQLYGVQKLIQHVSEELPGMATQAKVVVHMIGKIVELPEPHLSLRQYLGVESGQYRANGLNRHILTGYKSADIRDNLYAQAEGTELHAQFLLTQVRDEKDLLQGFFGIDD